MNIRKTSESLSWLAEGAEPLAAKKMAILPPDPLFRYKHDMGHLHTMCFQDTTTDEEDATQHNILIAAGETGNVHFIDMHTHRELHSQRMGNSIQVVHSYRHQVIVQLKEGLVSIYRPSNNSPPYHQVFSMACSSGFCRSLRIDNTLIIPQETTLDVFDLDTLKILRSLPQPAAAMGQLMCLAHSVIHGDGVLLLGYETGDVYLLDLLSGAIHSHCKLNECLVGLALDGVRLRGVAGGVGGVLQVFAVDKLKRLKLQAEIPLTNEGCTTVRVRWDSKILVSGGIDGRTRVYSWKTLRQLAVLCENSAPVSDVQWSRDGQVMAICGADGVISLFNIYNG